MTEGFGGRFFDADPVVILIVILILQQIGKGVFCYGYDY